MFVNNLKALLKSQGKKQSDLAQFVGVKPNTVSDWINKGNSPKIEHLCRIAEYFSVSLDFLLTGKEATSSHSASFITNSAVVQGNSATTLIVKNGHTEERELKDQEVELLRIFNILDIRKQTSLMSYAYELEDEK